MFVDQSMTIWHIYEWKCNTLRQVIMCKQDRPNASKNSPASSAHLIQPETAWILPHPDAECRGACLQAFAVARLKSRSSSHSDEWIAVAGEVLRTRHSRRDSSCPDRATTSCEQRCTTYRVAYLEVKSMKARLSLLC